MDRNRAAPGDPQLTDSIVHWLRHPLLHFLAGGTLLFAVVRLVGTHDRDAGGAPVVITAADIATMRDAYLRETGLQPTAADEAALVDRAVDEELLFREALARGLDRDRSVRSWLIEQMRVLSDDARAGDDDLLYTRAVALGLDHKDLVVRRILVQKMRLLAARAGEEAVGDDTLRAFYERHRDDYRSPARIDVWHVYLAPTNTAAATLATGAAAGVLDVADAVGRGDPFPQPPHLVRQSRQQLAKLFGGEVADRVLAAPEAKWVGPLRSALGAHLFWIDRRELDAAPSFDAVRGRVLEAWRQERRAQRLSDLLVALRERQPLRVESSAWRAWRRA